MASKTFKIIGFPTFRLRAYPMQVNLETSCALNLISTCSLLSLDRYLWWWYISPRGYHPPSIRCFDTDMVY